MNLDAYEKYGTPGDPTSNEAMVCFSYINSIIQVV